ncbi:hypothetical protein, partial [Acinetobacter baumannii]|uniref:hypothetical protein n=1 Tax=Acinetobacter baumannii TaxID=470 RepID=UPI001C0A1BCF
QKMLANTQLSTSLISGHVTTLQQQFLRRDPLPDMRLLNPLDGKPHARFLAFQGSIASPLHDALGAQNI